MSSKVETSLMILEPYPERNRDSSTPLGMTIELTLVPIRHDQISFLVVPAISESEVERRRIALPKKFLEPGLVMLFEEIDGAEVNPKKTQVPLVWIEISQGNSGVVLQDPGTLFENEIADHRETLLEHQIRRRLQKTRADPKSLTKFQETGRG